MGMRKRIFFAVVTIACLGAIVFAQDFDPVERAARWKEFSRRNFDQFNFAKVKLTKAKITNLKEDENADDFALLRGVSLRSGQYRITSKSKAGISPTPDSRTLCFLLSSVPTLT